MKITQYIQSLFNLKQDLSKVLVLADQAIVSGGNFLLGLVLIRLLGLEQYGLFAMLWMGVLFALSLQQAFITKPLMTLAIGQNKAEQQNYFHALWNIQTVFGSGLILLLSGLTFVGLSYDWATNWLVYVPIIVVIAFFYLLQDFIKKTFFIIKNYAKPLIMDTLNYTIIFLGLLYFYLTESTSLWNTLIVIGGGYLISTLLYSKRFFFKNISAIQPNYGNLLKKHYHFSSWLLGTSILQWFSGNFFIIIAASTLGTTAVGAVRMGQNIVGLCHILFLAMENIVPAEAAQLFLQKNPQILAKYLLKIGLKIGAIVLSILAIMAIAAPNLIHWIYGASFVSYSYVVWGYCLLYIFVYIGYPIRYFFRTIHFTKPIFIAYCVGTLFSLAVAFPIINTWGITGLLLGLILCQLLTLMVYAYFLWEKMKPSDKPHTLKISNYSNSI